MRHLIVLAALACACAQESGPAFPQGGQWIDLTHSFGRETIYWPTAEGFKHQVESFEVTEKGYFYAS